MIPVSKIDINGVIIKTYRSKRQAAIKNKISVGKLDNGEYNLNSVEKIVVNYFKTINT